MGYTSNYRIRLPKDLDPVVRKAIRRCTVYDGDVSVRTLMRG